MFTKHDFHVYGLSDFGSIGRVRVSVWATYRISSIPLLAGLTMTFQTILNRLAVSVANLNRNLLKLNLRHEIIL
jgi:hypothetical protein